MLIYEYRVVLPMKVEEYQIAQLYSVAETSKKETGGGEGVEVLMNEPFTATSLCPPDPLCANNKTYTEGQYTHKVYHLNDKVPHIIKLIAPKGSLEIHEKAWNAYPYCRTVITNPGYMKNAFVLKIETIHLPGNGQIENAHSLSPEHLKSRTVVMIDIANNSVVSSKDYKKDEDPTIYKSEKTGRGPLIGNWMDEVDPVMTCYKLVSVNFSWMGLQSQIEKFIQGQEKRIFNNFHRQVFCWTDYWFGMTLEDIRSLEEKTKEDLDKQRCLGSVRGTT
ncbi:phosphatidylinositol transfer protein alpha isoform isoform X1 [Octopus sinensis]|uniref:Phosphatidylinositol transfer protein alpha isoform isoform X1 n=2 Tax=Octopus sinensis TaxID=2607531 RepID=A0A6P7SHA1_9MOLL|nr:phosphatidylinositol transfer protein alpha isoform isoform X1 [Octopus sinensis]